MSLQLSVHCAEESADPVAIPMVYAGAGVSLLQWQSHEAMAGMEGDGGFAVQQLQVQCCKDICTVLVHTGAEVEGRSQSQVTQVCLSGGAQQLFYIRHRDGAELVPAEGRGHTGTGDQ
ncbi:hypothetical protein TURU_057232 [Turdus rufiventris]|nr:hypothetical protein TURU_057232 [Turdus rufiventris]